MVDLKLELPVTEEVEIGPADRAEILAAIQRGAQDADEGQTVSLVRARQLIPQWITKFESQEALQRI